jgi:hypothetical protein
LSRERRRAITGMNLDASHTRAGDRKQSGVDLDFSHAAIK